MLEKHHARIHVRLKLSYFVLLLSYFVTVYFQGLATHEPHFTILREEFKPNQKKPCDLCGQVGRHYISGA